jgi:hypothetical protein
MGQGRRLDDESDGSPMDEGRRDRRRLTNDRRMEAVADVQVGLADLTDQT